MEKYVLSRFLFYWMLLDLSVHRVLSSLTVKPKDTVTMVGKSSYFDCATTIKDKEIHWYHRPIGAQGDPEFVYGYQTFRGRYQGRYHMERNELTGAFNLLITNVNEGDAGEYKCQDDVGTGDYGQAQLIVITSEPKCSSNMTSSDVVIGRNDCGFSPEAVQFSCSVKFNGNSQPVLEWIRTGTNVPLTDGVTMNKTSDNMTTSLTLEGGVSSVGDQSFICRITINSISTEYSCSTGVVRLWSATNDFSLIKKPLNRTVDCQKKDTSQPSLCSYKWTRADEKGEVVVSNAPEMTPESLGVYRCQMDCTVKKKPCSINGMIVEVSAATSTITPPCTSQTDKNDSYKVAFIVILVILILLIVVLIVAFVVCRKRQRTRNHEKAELLSTDKDERIRSLETELQKERDNKGKLVGIEYAAKPVLIKKVQTKVSKSDDKSIKGLALLNNEIYIISQRESEVEVFDSTSLDLSRTFKLDELTCPEDASACAKNRCLYISENKQDLKEILRIDPNGKLITKWQIGNEFCRLSVSPNATVVAIFHDNSKLVEYSADGNSIRSYDLSLLNMQHPMHAVKLKTGNFLIVHGYLQDREHRLCEMDPASNRIAKYFGGEKGGGSSHLSNPTCLAVDREGSIMIADATNGRVVLLGSNFEFKREIVTKVQEISIPTRILLDELNGRLYIGDYKSKSRLLYAFSIL